MDAAFRDLMTLVPSLAVAAMSQIAAGALSSAAQLLDEHGHMASVVARHTASRTADMTDTLSNRIAQNAFVYANRSAYAAQQTAETVSSVSNTLMAAAEAAVHCATARAQDAVRRQADSWQQYAQDQAVAANQSAQDAVQAIAGHIPGLVPEPPATGAPSQPQPATAAAASATVHSVGMPVGEQFELSTLVSSVPGGFSTAAAPAASTRTAGLPETQAEQLSAALAAAQAALADAQQQLIVKQLVSDIFRAIERTAAHEVVLDLRQQLQQSRADLEAAALQLESAAATVAALPAQMTLLVQQQLRRSIQRAEADNMDLALATEATTAAAAATAEAGASTDGTDLQVAPAAEQPPASAAVVSTAPAGVVGDTAAAEGVAFWHSAAQSSSDGDSSSELDGGFCMVDLPASDSAGN